MNLDMNYLQPTHNTILSYNIPGMADTETLSDWSALSSKNTSAGVASSFMAITNLACLGLMSNETALTRLRVQHCYLQFLGPSLCMCPAVIFALRCTNCFSSQPDVVSAGL